MRVPGCCCCCRLPTPAAAVARSSALPRRGAAAKCCCWSTGNCRTINGHNKRHLDQAQHIPCEACSYTKATPGKAAASCIVCSGTLGLPLEVTMAPHHATHCVCYVIKTHALRVPAHPFQLLTSRVAPILSGSSAGTPSGSSPMEPSARRDAQKRRKAMELRATSKLQDKPATAYRSHLQTAPSTACMTSSTKHHGSAQAAPLPAATAVCRAHMIKCCTMLEAKRARLLQSIA